MRSLRVLMVSGALALSMSAASAADVFAVSESSSGVALPSLYTWTGPYAGGFVGYNFSNFDQSGGADFDGDGFIGGVYTGYNLQSDRVVYGVEADIGASGVDGSGFNAGEAAPIGADAGAFGSLRARVGYAYDSILLFATGGVAVGTNELTLDGQSDDNTHFGFTVGAGLEALMTDNITSRVEYRYSDFESRDYNLGNVTISSGYDEHSIRAGLALKF